MKPFVLALALLNMADAISFMIVTPSLAFYVTSLGGSQDCYGFVLAVYSFMSFCCKPALGRWSDAYNFSVPFRVSICFATLGGLLYAIAPAFTNSTAALTLVTLGRIFGGMGKANQALTFAYVARACPANERTSVSTILGGVQMVGMAVAPVFSAFLSKVNFTLFGVPFNSLNSVGLVIMVLNIASQIMIDLYLPDLPKSEERKDDDVEHESEWMRMFRCILKNPHIAVPFLTTFIYNFNWQFTETALAPSALDALQLGPVQVSYILGIMAIVVFVGMSTVHQVSKRGVGDFNLLLFGLFGNTIGYLMMYFVWYRGVHYLAFIMPVFISAGCFPFMGAPNRSLFSEAVDKTPELYGFEGTMQALLSMAASVGGFTAPSFITHFCLRTPEEVSLSSDSREFTPITLLAAPLLSFAGLCSTFLAGDPKKIEDELMEGPLNETTPLTHKSPTHKRMSLEQKGRRASARGSIVCSMGLMPQTSDIYDDEEEDEARRHRRISC